MRLHRYLAQCGVASRRKAEELILEGRVTVNGEVVNTLGHKIDEGDTVCFEGNPVKPVPAAVYVMNKPKGVITTLHDPQGRKTVKDYFPSSVQSLKPVGRLDRDTDGLLLLTSDGELAMRLTHARFKVEKEYKAVVRGTPDDHDLRRLENGIVIEGYKTKPAVFEVTGVDRKSQNATMRVILHEGRKRQIRAMCEAVGHPVVDLRRIRIGNLTVKGLRPGEVRLLGKKDEAALRAMVGL